MRLTQVLPLAALSTAFVLPPQEVIENIQIEENHRGNGWYQEAVKEKDEVVSSIKEHYSDIKQASHDIWEQAFESASNSAEWAQGKVHDASSGIESWLETEADDFSAFFDEQDGPHHPPHDGDGHHGPPHHGPPHHGPHHPPQHGKPNQVRLHDGTPHLAITDLFSRQSTSSSPRASTLPSSPSSSTSTMTWSRP